MERNDSHLSGNSFPILGAVAGALAVCVVAGALFSWQPPEAGDSRTFASAFEIPDIYTSPLLIRLTDLAISILPIGARPARAATEGNVVRYVDAYENTDIVQTKQSDKIKEDIVLKQPGHPALFEYQIDLTSFDFIKDSEGNLIFYQKGYNGDESYRRFSIPAPFMVDAAGTRSATAAVAFTLREDGRLTMKPSAAWLATARYPVILDPTIEINVINVHAHPQQGENWTVNFTTQGTADLKIIPNDQATIDDDEFVSLSCGAEKRYPQILAGDVISYQNWSCGTTATVVHYTKKAGTHTLRIDFGGKIRYAYNSTVLSATGGTLTEAGGYRIHTFTTSGTLSVTGSGRVEVLVIGGGGGGGSGVMATSNGGGGGGGGYQYDPNFAVSAGDISVTIGEGGGADTNGQDSVFSTITAIGGGKGGTSIEGVGQSGGVGGSGGGAAGDGVLHSGGTGLQGGNGAPSVVAGAVAGGGGGASGTFNVSGGDGIANTISNALVTYAGGGGGARSSGALGSGGAGGGGNSATDTLDATAGAANTGGGGGGGWVNGHLTGGSGGSGIVIVRYHTQSDEIIFRGGTSGSPQQPTIFRRNVIFK